MKKIVILIIFAIVFGFQQKSYCKEQYRNVEAELEKIKKSVYSCMMYAPKQKAKATKCLDEAIVKYNSEIEYMISVLKTVMSESEILELTKTQKEWENYMKQYNNLMKNTFESTSFDMPKLNSAAWKYRYVESHAENLFGIYILYVFFKSDGII